MIIVYGGGPGFGLPDVSPYVTKTEVQLQMAGLAYRKEQAPPDRSPKGQMPFIDDGGALVADSTFIRAHVERKYDLDLDEGLGPVERAHAWAIERMLENYLSWVSSYYRWLMPENFEKGPAHFFDGAPEPMRESLRDDVRARVADRIFGVGITRHTPEEILELGDRSLLALSEILGDKPYFGGERPVGVDATAFAMLAGIMTPFFDSPLRQRAIGYRNLTAYVDRMMLQYFPQHDWASSRLASAANAEEVN